MTGASIRFPHLGIVIEHLGKSISIFGFDIAYYGIIIGVGMLCGIAMAVHEAKRTGQNPEMYYDFALCAIISAIVGCRIYYVAFECPITVSILWRSLICGRAAWLYTAALSAGSSAWLFFRRSGRPVCF